MYGNYDYQSSTFFFTIESSETSGHPSAHFTINGGSSNTGFLGLDTAGIRRLATGLMIALGSLSALFIEVIGLLWCVYGRNRQWKEKYEVAEKERDVLSREEYSFTATPFLRPQPAAAQTGRGGRKG